MLHKIPNQIKEVLKKLETAGFEAYIVGGCVRDLIAKRVPSDWDVATNARPEEIIKIFPDSFYENDFGTVGVKVEKMFLGVSEKIIFSQEEKKRIIDIAKDYLEKSGDILHGVKHSEEVFEYAKEINKNYGVSEDVLEVISHWHDAGVFWGYENHVENSRKLMQESLKGIVDADSLKILSRLILHRSSDRPFCLEQRILKEADMLSAISEWRMETAKSQGKTEHADWIKKDGQELVSDFSLEGSLSLLKSSVSKVNEKLGTNLKVPESFPCDVVEVTTYRTEGTYSDKRRPDAVEFAETLEEDLKRRDFTVNALAIKIKDEEFEIIDLFEGQTDLEKKIIRAVGNPEERFSEDALRMMRAVRFHAELGFEIEKKTLEAIRKNSKDLKFVALERIKDELTKIIISDNPALGIEMLHKVGLLEYIIPELEKGIGVGQNRHHIHNIWEHNLLSLKFCPSKKLEVRLAALLHDIAKPQTKRGEGEFSTFYNHDHVGARVAKKILERLRFSNGVIEKVYLLIDNHMFYYNVDEVTESSVRRLIRKVGLENMQDLIDLRIADRLGSGTPKAKPYKLRHLEYIIEKVSHDAVSVKMLKVNGNDLMQELGMEPSPKIGAILEVLLSEVIEEASKNEKEILLARAKELMEEDLERLRDMAKEKIEEKKEEDDQTIKNKHWVK